MGAAHTYMAYIREYPPGIPAENNLLFELIVLHSSFSRDLFHPREDVILFRFIPDRPDSTSPDPIMRVKQRLTINSKSLQVHKRNAIKLGLKSPLKAGQERKKIHVTALTKQLFFGLRTWGSLSSIWIRVRTIRSISCLCSKEQWQTSLWNEM